MIQRLLDRTAPRKFDHRNTDGRITRPSGKNNRHYNLLHGLHSRLMDSLGLKH
ncbi:hypothetical protein CFBP498_49770 (plasmid) [Xanthomonas hortorum pv. vitians]|uniref:Uncharacterized protein n=1 Tax=Xanthomonas hortorum pv. vitians TaxID=83224 RepID=A0A6V7FJF6_9XANT|nr:hypothetical protein CFBP498_49770 [Xanthomonas hortorum pv. vitians]CAD0363916.1 hypothetical protein CFBP498_49770 [Xanthomonas hortorum pv. vitians]